MKGILASSGDGNDSRNCVDSLRNGDTSYIIGERNVGLYRREAEDRHHFYERPCNASPSKAMRLWVSSAIVITMLMSKGCTSHLLQSTRGGYATLPPPFIASPVILKVIYYS